MKNVIRLLIPILLFACSPQDMSEPDKMVENMVQTESASEGLMGGSLFGMSGYGTNFSCPTDKCVCDKDPGGSISDDCFNLALSGECKSGTFSCSITNPPVCTCTYDPGVPIMGGTGCQPGNDPNCILTKVYLGPGLYKFANNAAVYKRRVGHDRACHITLAQYTALGNPAITTVTYSGSVSYLNQMISGQDCTNEEAGVTHGADTFSNGLHQLTREANPRLMKLFDQRACRVTPAQYATLVSTGKGAFVALTGSITFNLFVDSFVTNAGGDCRDMEFSKHM